VEGEGVLMLPASQAAGVPLVWGEAPVLVRTTTVPGSVKIRAEIAGPSGDWTPQPAEIELQTVEPLQPLLYLPAEETRSYTSEPSSARQATNDRLSETLLREVERQQQAFGE
ncbi:MAG: hypothetical protein K2K83_01155, partial [Rikenella sp.]|nr:hypothetical protein [Rikenella sp.]